MKDLISREAAMALARININRTIDCNDIARLPAVDAVEVVRCKDCVYRGNASKCPMCWAEWVDDPFDGMDSVVTNNTTDDGFCYFARRRTRRKK